MSKRKLLSRMLTSALLAFLGGCAVGPDYVAPEFDMPAAWAGAPQDMQVKVRADALAEWWTLFDDPALVGLVKQAVSNSPDLEIALARVREARAQQGVVRADLIPGIDASSSASTTSSEDRAGVSDWRELYTAGVDAVWEIDIFGGRRRSLQSANANIEIREADYFDVLISLAAETAFTYVDIRAFQERLQITQSNLEAQQETLALTLWRAQAGIGTSLEVEQARSNLESTLALIPALEGELAAALNRLSIILGEAPGGLDAIIVQRGPVPVATEDMAAGVPADLLRQRPDIRSAERSLAFQSARIGVAEANLYPKFFLLGSIGGSSMEISDIFGSANVAKSFSSSITTPIFQAGRLRQNVRVEDALFEQALAGYESTVLSALKEVEDAFASLNATRQTTDALENGVDAARNAYEFARLEYEAGVINFFQVLDAQRSLLTQEDSLVQSRASETTAAIALYKALGGGWDASATNETVHGY